MNPQFAEQLRNSMERFTEHVEMPPGLARSAGRRWHKRRLMTRAAVAATTAVVAGATVAIAAAGSSGNAPSQSYAYVVSRVENALATVGNADYIAFSRSITTSHSPDFPSGTDLTWYTRDRFNHIAYTSSGRPYFSLTVTRVPGGLQMVTVQYEHRFVGYQDELMGARTARDCGTAAAVLSTVEVNPGDMTNWPATIRALLGCHVLKVAGHQRAGRTDLIRFVQAQADYPMTLLVNPSTFLPSRMVVTSSQPGQAWTTTTEFGSLPPTRANLAHLSAPIPAGFTQSHFRPEAAGGSFFGTILAWLYGQ
jgi:hypothetical protein